MTVAATQRCLIDRHPVDPEDYDRFGSSVALSGNGRTLVVGMVSGPELHRRFGRVYTYDWDDGDEEWVIRPVKYYNSQRPGSTIATVEWMVPDGWANAPTPMPQPQQPLRPHGCRQTPHTACRIPGR